MILIWTLVLYFQNSPNKLSELLLGSMIPQFLREISYSVYALHMINYYFCVYVLETINISNPYYFSILVLVTSLALTILLSYLGNKYIEQYFVNLGRKIVKKPN